MPEKKFPFDSFLDTLAFEFAASPAEKKVIMDKKKKKAAAEGIDYSDHIFAPPKKHKNHADKAGESSKPKHGISSKHSRPQHSSSSRSRRSSHQPQGLLAPAEEADGNGEWADMPEDAETEDVEREQGEHPENMYPLDADAFCGSGAGYQYGYPEGSNLTPLVAAEPPQPSHHSRSHHKPTGSRAKSSSKEDKSSGGFNGLLRCLVGGDSSKDKKSHKSKSSKGKEREHRYIAIPEHPLTPPYTVPSVYTGSHARSGFQANQTQMTQWPAAYPQGPGMHPHDQVFSEQWGDQEQSAETSQALSAPGEYLPTPISGQNDADVYDISGYPVREDYASYVEGASSVSVSSRTVVPGDSVSQADYRPRHHRRHHKSSDRRSSRRH